MVKAGSAGQQSPEAHAALRAGSSSRPIATKKRTKAHRL